MSKKYNIKYQKGKYTLNSKSAILADLSKKGKYAKSLTQWLKDTRKWDYPGIDDGSPESFRRIGLNGFGYTKRSELRKSPKSKDHKRYRVYYRKADYKPYYKNWQPKEEYSSLSSTKKQKKRTVRRQVMRINQQKKIQRMMNRNK